VFAGHGVHAEPPTIIYLPTPQLALDVAAVVDPVWQSVAAHTRNGLDVLSRHVIDPTVHMELDVVAEARSQPLMSDVPAGEMGAVEGHGSGHPFPAVHFEPTQEMSFGGQ
jgi:hypothetical protein